MPDVEGHFGEYVAARWSALVRYATLLCGDAGQAEELVQSALVKVALRWDRVRDKDNPDAYVRQAVLRTFLSFWRRVRQREVPMADVPDRAGLDSTSAIVDRD